MSERKRAAIFAAIDSPVKSAGTRVLRRAGWYQVWNPDLKEPSENEVMLSHVPADAVETTVAETFAHYRGYGLPFKWAIGPMSSPTELEHRLAPLASASWGFRGMSIGVDATIPTSAGVRVERVGPANRDEFLAVSLAGWNLGQFGERARAKLADMTAHPQCRCFIARQGERAIGSASTILKSDHGNLVGAVVLEGARGLGAYRALVRERLADLRELGRHFAVSQAREATSAPILERLGFATEFQAKIYRFDG